MADLTEKLLNWLPMTAATVHDHGPAAASLRERYLRRHPGAEYWIGDHPWPTDGLLQGLLDVLVLRLAASADLASLAEQLLLQRSWLSPSGVILLAVPDQGALFSGHECRDLAQNGLHLTKQGIADGQRVLVLMAAKPQVLHILAIPLREQAGMVDVRIRQPLKALSTLPDVHADVLSLPIRASSILKPTQARRVILWQRPILSCQRDAKLVARIKQAGSKLVIDFDDHPSRWPQIEDSDFYTFRVADGLITSTPLLQKFLTAFCSRSYLYSNLCFEMSNCKQMHEAILGRPLQLLYASLNRSQDSMAYLLGINKFLQLMPKALRINVVGDRPFCAMLSTREKSYENIQSYSGYLKRLSDADIVFCPLEDNFFNSHKSPLKYVEAASVSTALLASPTVYSSVIKDRVNGCLIDPTTVTESLMWLCTHSTERERMITAAAEDVRCNYMLWNTLSSLRSWFLQLSNNV